LIPNFVLFYHFGVGAKQIHNALSIVGKGSSIGRGQLALQHCIGSSLSSLSDLENSKPSSVLLSKGWNI